jgi:CRP/FNR family transcriptional regulator
MNTTLTNLIRGELLRVDGVRRLTPSRRFTVLFTGERASNSVYFVDSGWVKVVRRGEENKEVIVRMVGPGELLCEQAILDTHICDAEVLQDAEIYEIPRPVFLNFCDRRPEAWRLLFEVSVQRQAALEDKVALLCLEDVEFRILHYLAELAPRFANADEHQEYSLPLSQSELAALIGATRETTSTTLNALARQGLLRLGRRLVTVHSIDKIRAARTAAVDGFDQIGFPPNGHSNSHAANGHGSGNGHSNGASH